MVQVRSERIARLFFSFHVLVPELFFVCVCVLFVFAFECSLCAQAQGMVTREPKQEKKNQRETWKERKKGTNLVFSSFVYCFFCSFTRADFFGVGSWIPCILYSSSVCFGSIGRQLDVVPETWYRNNSMTKAKHFKEE